jgi:hypothetical protein
MGKTRDILETAHNRYMEERNRQTVIQRCGLCDWKVEGLFGETRLLAIEHRREFHPEAKQRTRRPSYRAGLRTIGTRSLDENIALNRAQGAAMWASETEL